MFRVDVDSLEAYLDFDPRRKPDLLKLDALIRKAAPALKRHFHAGTPAGEAGMRMKMIGYGKFHYAIKSGETAPWPVIGVALQKNYISVYLAVTKDGAPIVRATPARSASCAAAATISASRHSTISTRRSRRTLFAEAARSSRRIPTIRCATCKVAEPP